ncbi:MAG: hypothetical protein AB8H86_18145 [Polyangiales bacterium]
MKRLIPVFLLCAIACGDDSRANIDSGITRIDSGIDADDGPPSGPDAGDTLTCEDPYPNLVPISEANPADMILPRCASTTAQCIVDCESDGDCIDACIAADSTPPLVDGTLSINCDDCITFQSLACFENFCAPQFADLRCCLEDNDCEDADCPACTTQFSAFTTCRDGDSVLCGDFIGPCFPN